MDQNTIEAIAQYIGSDVQTWKGIASRNSTDIAVIKNDLTHVRDAAKATHESVKELKASIDDGVEKIHKRINDHMDEEESTQESLEGRLEKIEKFILILTSKWSMLAVIAGVLLWPILIPLIQKVLVNYFLPEELASSLLTFMPLTLHL